MTAEKLSEEKPGEEKAGVGEGQSGGENPSDNTASAVPASGDKPNQTSGDKGGDAAGDVDAKSGEAGKVGGGKASSGDAGDGKLEASSGGVTGAGEAGKEGGKEDKSADQAPVAGMNKIHLSKFLTQSSQS